MTTGRERSQFVQAWYPIACNVITILHKQTGAAILVTSPYLGPVTDTNIEPNTKN
jgi:hypothetical protein